MKSSACMSAKTAVAISQAAGEYKKGVLVAVDGSHRTSERMSTACREGETAGTGAADWASLDANHQTQRTLIVLTANEGWTYTPSRIAHRFI